MEEIIIYGRESEINRRLSSMLQDENYSTGVFDDQDKLSDYLKRKSPLLIVFECQSACIEDAEQISFINTIAADFSLPILLIISREQIPRFNGSIHSKKVSYLEKPILHANLMKRVRGLLDKGIQ